MFVTNLFFSQNQQKDQPTESSDDILSSSEMLDESNEASKSGEF